MTYKDQLRRLAIELLQLVERLPAGAEVRTSHSGSLGNVDMSSEFTLEKMLRARAGKKRPGASRKRRRRSA